MPNTYILNNQQIKSIDLPQYPDSAWDILAGTPEFSGDIELKARVAAANSAVNKVANVFASVPFSIMQGKNEIDSSDEYKNSLGWLPYPKSLLRLWMQSIIMTNRAYGFREGRGNSITKLRYIAPQTITKIDTDANGITAFTRSINGQSQVYTTKERRIFYAFALQFNEELLPGENTLFRAIASAASVLYYADFWVNNFYKNGGIRPHMLMVKGAPNKDARDRIQDTWSKLMRGVRGAIGKIFDAEAIEAKPLGDGIDSMKGSPIYDNALRNIAIGLGMPQDMLIQDSANYATAQVHQSAFWQDVITPMCDLFAEALNEQIFFQLGYTWRFNTQTVDANQQDEVEKAGAAKTLYDIMSAEGYEKAAQFAFDTVGIEVPSWWDWDAEKPEEEPEPEPQPIPPAPVDEEIPDVEDEPADMEEMPSKFMPSFDQLKELKDWRDIAQRKFKRGEWPMQSWQVKTLPADVAAGIESKLAQAQDADEIKAAFELDTMPEQEKRDDTALLALADAINRYAEMSTKETKAVEPVMPNVTINLTAEMPAVGASPVTINVPEQAAPVVNVTNEVQPAQPVVEVKNEITAQAAPAQVILPAPVDVDIIRDRDGKAKQLKARK